MNLKKVVYVILFISALIFSSCSQDENDNDLNNEQAIEKPLTAEAIQTEVFAKNKSLINKFYDDIGFEIFDLILKDRVYEKKPESRTKLKGIPLDSFPRYLSGEKENNTREYALRFITFKTEVVNSETNEELIANFKNAKTSLLKNTFYTDTILKGQKEDVQYDNLEKSISGMFDKTLDEVESNKIDYLEVKSSSNEQQQGIDTEQSAKFSFYNMLKNYSWWLFGLFLISLLLNLFQFLKYKKTKKQSKNALNKVDSEKQEISLNHSSFQPKATKLRDSEVKNSIEQAYEKLQQALKAQYHRDCLQEVSLKFDNLKTDTLLEASSSSFNSKTELQLFIDKKISQDKATLNYELKDYVAKNDAKLEIDNRIIAQNLVQGINTKMVQEEDIANKVHQLKQIAISELQNVTTRATLNSTINSLEKDIDMALQKMVQDNSVFYFAFADSNGTLQDVKKTKTIERDSAIQLSVNQDDTTKATFRLLLEKDDMMQAGIMSYDSFLIPICEVTSDNFNSKGTTIEQIGPDGTMELENGIWKVKNKLPIKVI